MAGWKLRKDKTSAETPSVDTEKPMALEQDSPDLQAGDTPIEETSPAPSDWLVNGWHAPGEEALPVAELHPLPSVSEIALPQPDFESEDALHFVDDDPPLTLVDYTEAAAPELAASDSSAFEATPHKAVSQADSSEEPGEPTPMASSLFTTPRVDLSDAPLLETDDGSDLAQTLRMNREEIAEAFPAPVIDGDIPTVAPFVLDTPFVSPVLETAHRLVVQIGRLSASFELTKDVTVIGRPDSNLQSYPDIEIEMDDAVSRRHAEVVKHEDGYYLADAGSTNGTRLNGALLPPHIEHRLAHGDRIRVGERTEIVFE